MRGPFFGDVDVRQAMSYAFPRDRILKEVYFDIGQPMASVIHPDQPEYNHDRSPWPYDLAKAKALLDQCWLAWMRMVMVSLKKMIDGEKKKFEITMSLRAHNKETPRLVSIYQQSLQQLGIKLEMKAMSGLII